MPRTNELLPPCFVILDSEYTSWAGSMERAWTRESEHRELVQVGALLVENSVQRLVAVKSLNVLVRPVRNPILSRYFTQLTGISQSNLEARAISVDEAVRTLHAFTEGGTLPIFTWGWGDEEAFLESSIINNIIFNDFFPLGFTDITPIFRRLGIETQGYQSGTIHEIAGNTLEGRTHDALFDAQSILCALNYAKTSV